MYPERWMALFAGTSVRLALFLASISRLKSIEFSPLPFSFSKSIKNNTSSKSFLQNLSPSIALKRNKSRRRRERKGSNEKWMDRKILEWKIQRAMNTRFLTDRCINFLASSRYYRESWGSWFIYIYTSIRFDTRGSETRKETSWNAALVRLHGERESYRGQVTARNWIVK